MDKAFRSVLLGQLQHGTCIQHIARSKAYSVLYMCQVAQDRRIRRRQVQGDHLFAGLCQCPDNVHAGKARGTGDERGHGRSLYPRLVG